MMYKIHVKSDLLLQFILNYNWVFGLTNSNYLHLYYIDIYCFMQLRNLAYIKKFKNFLIRMFVPSLKTLKLKSEEEDLEKCTLVLYKMVGKLQSRCFPNHQDKVLRNLNQRLDTKIISQNFLNFIFETNYYFINLNFNLQVHLLATLYHRNVVSLVGYCNEGKTKALIYDYMAGGDLQHQLLGWSSFVFKSSMWHNEKCGCN